jgi:hypothetical protein
MARNDKYFPNVVESLFKEGFIVTKTPLYFTLGSNSHTYKIDLAAERTILIAEKASKEKIAVEVKSFLDPSFINDFKEASGQYRIYTHVLSAAKADDYKLYLAVPDKVYKDHFTDTFITSVCAADKISIITFDPTINRIMQWIKR